MTSRTHRAVPRWARVAEAIAVAVILAVVLLDAPARAGETDPLAHRRWVWPVEAVQGVRPFEAPAHRYAAGHRGIDLGSVGRVRSPAAGTVAFAGAVAGRPVVTIDHGDGLVTTFEPVTTSLREGDPVARGDPVGEVATGGHVVPGAVHFGVRWNGEYVNPLRLLGGVPRAILLPCC
ncbi:MULTISPECIES: murein hydrolase activator EnvC family protein [Microbacterium]|jgi:murein DD-endopeptidase MepM/ murein hydrolase activator NlpD|uniref:murein hydrolase activator EnvC family protein n=1 Tax=Microbacterium TaxID=33882 RepID=UPI001D17D30F|nr:M23 family metallopeptidase [Microbacterium testaceum]MCC4250598.1 M23 family metallopeptidase [Microbacterium testaceum]